MTYTLGICIPTYKRPEFLRRCVLSAINASEGKLVRIFISDDSLDETNTFLFDELKSFSNLITVHRNTINLGIDDNIQKCIDLCDCDYAWIVGEDDFFFPGSVSRIFDKVQALRAPFIFANYAYVGDDSSGIIGLALDASEGLMSGGDFISKHLWSAGFIGACIVDRHLWNITKPLPYKGTYYTHVGRLCELIAYSEEPIYIIAEPCVANRVEGKDTFTWRHDSYGVFFGFCKMCEAVANQCPALSSQVLKAAKVMEQRYGWLTIQVAMRLRSEHGYDVKQFKRYIEPNIDNSFRRYFFFVISIIPAFLFRPLIFIYRIVAR